MVTVSYKTFLPPHTPQMLAELSKICRMWLKDVHKVIYHLFMVYYEICVVTKIYLHNSLQLVEIAKI